MRTFAGLQHLELDLRSLGAVGSAGSLALAAIFTGMLCVAAALSLTVILSFAGVFGECRCVLCNQQQSGAGRRRAVLTRGLGVQASGCSAKKPGECGREGQVVYGIAFHEEHLSWLGRAIPRAGRDGCGRLQLRISRKSRNGRASGSQSKPLPPMRATRGAKVTGFLYSGESRSHGRRSLNRRSGRRLSPLCNY
jgi:hypothetical protein